MPHKKFAPGSRPLLPIPPKDVSKIESNKEEGPMLKFLVKKQSFPCPNAESTTTTIDGINNVNSSATSCDIVPSSNFVPVILVNDTKYGEELKQRQIDEKILSNRLRIAGEAKQRKLESQQNTPGATTAALTLKSNRPEIPRNNYSDDEKKYAIEYVELYMKQNKSTKMLAVQSLRLHQGYHSVTKGMINNWISRKDKNGDGTINLPRGRTVNHIFEAAVMNKLIICCLTEPVGDEMPRVEVVANAAFSYSLFIRAAAEVMEEDPFKNDPDLQTLTFSPKWVFNLIQRFKLRCQRNDALQK